MLAELTAPIRGTEVGILAGVVVVANFGWRIIEGLLAKIRGGNGNGKALIPGQAPMCIDHEVKLAAFTVETKFIRDSLRSLHEKVDKLK